MAHAEVQTVARLANSSGSDSNNTAVPDAAAYERAFREMLPSLSLGYRRMLTANLKAPGRAITPLELAVAAGYAKNAAVNAKTAAANLHYGTLARRLAETLGYRPTKLSLQGKPCHTFSLADWHNGKWVLLPNAVAALIELDMRE